MIEAVERWVLLAQIFSTLAMMGLIWFVQVVHYPLMSQVGEANFTKYEADHQTRTTIVVAPLMLCEMATAVMLLWYRPSGVDAWCVWLGLALLAIIWISTYAVQVPEHARLSEQFNAQAHRRLVVTNWTRTVAWTARGIVVLLML